MISNPFANYTLSITTQYHDTKARVEEAQKQLGKEEKEKMNYPPNELIYCDL